MYFDAPMRDGVRLSEAGAEAARAERLGFDAIWSFEIDHDPFFPLLQAALATERLGIGTNIAVAFARTPFSMAISAWDLQSVSGGRLLLGLGTQVRPHVERRFSAEFEHPAARIADYIDCLRAIWNTFQTGARPRYEGRFYRFTLINDFFNPGPIDNPDIPIYLAGVNPRMAAAAGEAADGFNVHPMHSPDYLREVIRPALAEGARKRGRSADAHALVTSCFVVRGATESERRRSELAVRRQIAFYASTPGLPDLPRVPRRARRRQAAERAHARRPTRRNAGSRERRAARRGCHQRSRRRPGREHPGPLRRRSRATGRALRRRAAGCGRRAVARADSVRQACGARANGQTAAVPRRFPGAVRPRVSASNRSLSAESRRTSALVTRTVARTLRREIFTSRDAVYAGCA